MGKWVCSLLVLAMAFAAFFAVQDSVADAAAKGKKAIVVVSFGTTFDDARRDCIESVENKIKEQFSGYEVRRAFTSRIVLSRLAERGIYADTLEQALDKLKEEGYTDIVIQSTHLTPGEEFEKKVLEPAELYKNSFASITIGRPILTLDGKNGIPNDFKIAVEALKKQLPVLGKGQEIVFMGHGSPHRHNPAYQALQEAFDAAKLPVTVGVVEETDHPNYEDVEARLLKKSNVKSILLMPLMLVAGDHANNDMAGDEEDSWKSLLAAKGYEVSTYVHGLGENKAFQNIYVQHIKDAIQNKIGRAHV